MFPVATPNPARGPNKANSFLFADPSQKARALLPSFSNANKSYLAHLCKAADINFALYFTKMGKRRNTSPRAPIPEGLH
jgi:hypothetical protein